MLVGQLDHLDQKNLDFKVESKSLLQSVALEFRRSQTPDEVVFQGRGTMRMGPKNSKIHLESRFRQKENQLVDYYHQVLAPGFFIKDEYKLLYGKVFDLKKNQPVSDQAQGVGSWIDPLSLLFAMQTEPGDFNREGLLLVGGKLRNYSLKGRAPADLRVDGQSVAAMRVEDTHIDLTITRLGFSVKLKKSKI